MNQATEGLFDIGGYLAETAVRGAITKKEEALEEALNGVAPLRVTK